MKYGIVDIPKLKPIEISAFSTIFDSGWGYQKKSPDPLGVRVLFYLKIYGR